MSRADVHRAQKQFVTALLRQDDWTYRHALAEACGTSIQPRLVADVGCGVGDSFGRLIDVVWPTRIIGLDLHADMLVEARAVSAHRGGVSLCQADALALPFADGTVDLAVCSGVLHSVKSQQRLIYELARITRHGGRVVIGNKGLAPWMGDTPEYAIAATCLGEATMEWPPIHLLPPCAQDVRLEYVGPSNAFYVLSFRISAPQPLNLEAQPPGLALTVRDLLHTLAPPPPED